MVGVLRVDLLNFKLLARLELLEALAALDPEDNDSIYKLYFLHLHFFIIVVVRVEGL